MSKKNSKTKARKATKRATDQTPESADIGTKTPTARKLICELAALNLSPKMVTKLEALSEHQQDTVLSYVNSGSKINDAYQRAIAGKPTETEPEANGISPTPEAATTEPGLVGGVTQGVEATQAAEVTAQPEAAKPTRASKSKKETGPKKLSAIDAAAKVLVEAGEPMNCQEMIKAMAERGYWTSPGGKTPHATLYSAILRELQTKRNDSRFKKTERGKFAFGKAS
jgi:hypothetical protein